jgi:hypothetical protein
MKYGILVLSALVLLGIGLATSHPAQANILAQAGTPAAVGTPVGGTVTVTSAAPANIEGRPPNDLVGYFPAIFLSLGILSAGIAALVSIQRDARKAARMRGPDAPGARH